MADNSLKELSEMQKLTSSMVKDFKSMLKGKEGVNKEIKKEFQLTQDIIKNLKSSEQIDKAIEEIKKKQSTLDEKKFGTNKGLLIAYESQLKAVVDSLNVNKSIFKAEEKRVGILNETKNIVDGISGKLKDQLGNLQSNIEKIPILGKLFNKVIPFDKLKAGVDDLSKQFMGGFKNSFTKSMQGGAGVSKSVLSGMRGGLTSMSTAVRALGPALAGPQAIIVAVVAVIALGVYRMYQMSEATKQFKQETGLLNSQVKFLGRQISYVSYRTKFLGADMKDVASASAAVSNQFHNLIEPSTAVVENIVVLNKNFGVSMDSAAKLTHMFMNMGNLTQEQAQAQTSIAVNMARAAKVAPSKVIKDLADNSEAAYKYFGGSYKELVKAGVEAAKLGTSIGALTKTADNLLEFESSITDELQASAVLGRRFDLTQARAAAAADDLLGMNKAIVSELNKQGDITQLSKWDKMALTKATKMELSELVNMQKVYNKFGHLQEEQIGYAMKQAQLGKDVSKMTESELKALMEKDRITQETQGKFTQMKNAFSGIGDSLLDAFLPIGEVVVGILVPAFKIIASFVKGVFTPLANVFKKISDKVSELVQKFGFMEEVGNVLGSIFEFIGTLIGGVIAFAAEYLLGTFEAIVDVVSGIVSIFKGIFSGDMDMIVDGIKQVFGGIIDWVLRIPSALYDAFVDMFPKIGEAISSFFSGVWDSITGFFGFGESDSGKVQKEAAAGMTDGGSVNDGVIQKGKIISTNPADTLIATKTPGDLLSQVMGATPLGAMLDGIGSLLGGSGGGPTANNINELIAEVKGLRMDMASGKIAVNMDGRKITSGVSKVSAQSSGNSYVQK